MIVEKRETSNGSSNPSDNDSIPLSDNGFSTENKKESQTNLALSKTDKDVVVSNILVVGMCNGDYHKFSHSNDVTILRIHYINGTSAPSSICNNAATPSVFEDERRTPYESSVTPSESDRTSFAVWGLLSPGHHTIT